MLLFSALMLELRLDVKRIHDRLARAQGSFHAMEPLRIIPYQLFPKVDTGKKSGKFENK
jgi:hypothetical protein